MYFFGKLNLGPTLTKKSLKPSAFSLDPTKV